VYRCQITCTRVLLPDYLYTCIVAIIPVNVYFSQITIYTCIVARLPVHVYS